MRPVITEQDIPLEGDFHVPAGALWTPSARDLASRRSLRIVEVTAEKIVEITPAARKVAIGADHGGVALKRVLKSMIEGAGFFVEDVGTHDELPVDYPDIAERVALKVAEGKVHRGVLIDGAGIGSAMAANKIPGVRAALCYDKASARNSREHNDSNVLTLGGRLLTQTQAEDVLRTWLATPFAGGRHQARVDKIVALERKYGTRQ
jgi:ribose 5-phosphate isomerase B